MKRKLKVFLCLITVIAMVAAFAAGCSDTPETPSGECEHTFSEKWSSDAENHWHAATCEHGEI